MTGAKIFVMDSDILETSDETTFECLLYKTGTNFHFVTANILTLMKTILLIIIWK